MGEFIIKEEITKEQFGDKWPFSVESGILYCPVKPLLFFIVDEKIYPVNGSACSKHKYFNAESFLDPIWKDHLEIPGAKVNIHFFIQFGLKKIGWK